MKDIDTSKFGLKLFCNFYNIFNEIKVKDIDTSKFGLKVSINFNLLLSYL